MTQAYKRVALRIAAAVCAVTVLTVVAPIQQDAHGAQTFEITATETLAPGVTFMRVQGQQPVNDIYVLKVDPSEDATLEVALANDSIPGHERTSSMAARQGAIAAVNGDFAIPPGMRGAGRPVNPLAIDGRLITSASIWGRNFALAHDESTAYLGHPVKRIRLKELDTGQKWSISGWHPRQNVEKRKLAGYTNVGGRSFRPPRKACAARLKPVGSLRWAERGRKLDRRYEVGASRCSKRRLLPKGKLVIATPWRTRFAKSFRGAVVRGDFVRVRWGFGWRGVMDTIGGNPTLFEKGVNTIGVCDPTVSYFCKRNPRTGVGWTPAGEVLMVVVDGRSTVSNGMTLDEFSALFQFLGAESALNMDGGGSSTMVVNGAVVNQPSDAEGERPVGSALLVLPGPDPNQPVPKGSFTWPVSARTTGAASTPMGPLQLCEALRDPASTGGLIEALEQRQLAGSHILDHALGRDIAALRRSRSC